MPLIDHESGFYINYYFIIQTGTKIAPNRTTSCERRTFSAVSQTLKSRPMPLYTLFYFLPFVITGLNIKAV